MLNVYGANSDCYKTRTDCYKTCADCYETCTDCYEVNNDSYEAHANHNRDSAILMQLAPTIAALLPIIADMRQTIFVLITNKRKVNHFKCEKRPKK